MNLDSSQNSSITCHRWVLNALKTRSAVSSCGRRLDTGFLSLLTTAFFTIYYTLTTFYSNKRLQGGIVRVHLNEKAGVSGNARGEAMAQ
jgi:hypothetical protein